MNLFFLILGFLIGCAVLTWGADQFVKSSTVIARHYRVPPLVVGMILVGFGTSCPELIVSLLASLKQAPEIAIGTLSWSDNNQLRVKGRSNGGVGVSGSFAGNNFRDIKFEEDGEEADDDALPDGDVGQRRVDLVVLEDGLDKRGRR